MSHYTHLNEQLVRRLEARKWSGTTTTLMTVAGPRTFQLTGSRVGMWLSDAWEAKTGAVPVDAVDLRLTEEQVERVRLAVVVSEDYRSFADVA